MSVRISTAQANYIFAQQKLIKTNGGNPIYTDIPGNTHATGRKYHYSWQGADQIVVGVGLGPGHHRNFTCRISASFAVSLTAGGGGLAIAGPSSIDVGALERSVTAALKARFKLLVYEENFNAIGRVFGSIYLWKSPITNRHNTAELVILGKAIDGKEVLFRNIEANNRAKEGKNKEQRAEALKGLVSGDLTGFAVVAITGGVVTKYHNYAISKPVEVQSEEPLRVIYGPAVALIGDASGTIDMREVV